MVRAADVRVVGVGSPALGRSAELAAAFGPEAQPLDDLRRALSSAEADVFVLAATGEFAAGEGRPHGHAHPGSDAAMEARSAAATLAPDDSALATASDEAVAITARRARGTLVISFDPMPSSVLDLETIIPAAAGGATVAEQAGVVLGQGAPAATALHTAPARGEWSIFLPLFRLGPAMRAAQDVLAHAGSIHTIAAEFSAGRGEGTVGARLFDVMDAITSLLGEPDSVDAAYVWPGRGRVVHPVPTDSLAGLRGAMSANVRFSDGRAASFLVADGSVGAGRWSRSLTIIGDGGRLSIRDDRFEFFSADGKSVDRSAGFGPSGLADGAAAFAEQFVDLLDPHAAGRPRQPVNHGRVLSAAGAALLSARTGEPESPGTILRMARNS